MKILHVCPYFAPAWGYGGTPKAAFELAKQQVETGFQVTVLTTDVLNQQKRNKKLKEIVSGVRVIRLRNLSNQLAWYWHQITPYDISNIPDLNQFDIIHIHEIRTILNLLVLLKLKLKKQLFISPWGTLTYNQQLVYFKRLFDFLLIPLLNKHQLIFLGQTSHELKIIKEHFPKSIKKLLSLGINQDEFINLPTKSVARKHFQLKNNDFVFVYLGRISPAKGLGLLINSFASLVKKNTKLKLLIIGRDDGYLSNLKKLVNKFKLEKQIKIYRAMYEEKRFLAYMAADCFISTPIIFEETSTTCLEALCCGTKVITSYQAEIPGLSKDDGVWHVKTNEKAIITAMEEVIKKPKLLINKKIKPALSWKTINKSLIKIYES